MKRWLVMICIGWLIVFVGFKNEKVKMVFQEDSAYARYEITFPEKGFSTKQVEHYFKDIQVLAFVPYRNPLYSHTLTTFSLDTVSLSKNISVFVGHEIAWLEKQGYSKDAINAKINGIYLKKMIVYGREEQIETVQNQLSALEYKKIAD